MSDSSISESYRRDGYYFPIPVLSGEEARECRRHLEAFEAEHQGLPEKIPLQDVPGVDLA